MERILSGRAAAEVVRVIVVLAKDKLSGAQKARAYRGSVFFVLGDRWLSIR